MPIIIDSEDESVETATACSIENNPLSTELSVEYLFISGVFRVNIPSFLDVVMPVHKEYISKIKKEAPDILKTVYPTMMTNDMSQDVRLEEFRNYIAHKSWEILNNQGYHMDLFDMVFQDIFGQEHHKYSGHDTHSHPGGQITGFYFLECPENSCKPVFQDPRQAKFHTMLPQTDMSNATLASHEINYTPVAGDFFFTNSWLPHSFTRNANVKPLKFIHFTLGVQQRQQIQLIPQATQPNIV